MVASTEAAVYALNTGRGDELGFNSNHEACMFLKMNMQALWDSVWETADPVEVRKNSVELAGNAMRLATVCRIKDSREMVDEYVAGGKLNEESVELLKRIFAESLEAGLDPDNKNPDGFENAPGVKHLLKISSEAVERARIQGPLDHTGFHSQFDAYGRLEHYYDLLWRRVIHAKKTNEIGDAASALAAEALRLASACASVKRHRDSVASKGVDADA